ncbi:MAG: hypothetical protein ACE5K4_08070 [Candidatus Hydrothermarchaeota archaeon]
MLDSFNFRPIRVSSRELLGELKNKLTNKEYTEISDISNSRVGEILDLLKESDFLGEFEVIKAVEREENAKFDAVASIVSPISCNACSTSKDNQSWLIYDYRDYETLLNFSLVVCADCGTIEEQASDTPLSVAIGLCKLLKLDKKI